MSEAPDTMFIEAYANALHAESSISSDNVGVKMTAINCADWGLTPETRSEPTDCGSSAQSANLGDVQTSGESKPAIAYQPPPQLPRIFLSAAKQEALQASSSVTMLVRPTMPQQITPAAIAPSQQQQVPAALGVPLQQMTSVVGAPSPYQQFQLRPQFHQPISQYYQNVQQPHVNLSHQPMVQMHASFGTLPILIPPVVVGDPMNDMASWSEHDAEDKRKYWYNRVNGTSTYDKPFCLKTPEERSIPHCKWKEYTSADEKKYYSDGKESSWTVPEEYRIWKERIDAVEAKKLALAANLAEKKTEASLNSHLKGDSHANGQSSSGKKKYVEQDDKPAPVYTTQEEAVEAFKALLSDKKILASMKMKEVTDLCQNDIRFRALRTAGERKQALAEFQTKSLKLEKEALKSKARKSRANFLVMLAENTVIDAHTRWREASTLLQEDARFKNVEDARDREDLFNDFVSELEKKEKEDRLKHRGEALKFLNTSLTARHSSGALSRKSTWTEEKEGFLKMQEVRFLDDAEVKRCFQDFIGKLDFAFKETERVKKNELQRKIDIASADLRELFEKLAYEGVISSNSRWSECSSRPCIADSTAFKELENLIKNEKHERNENTNNASVMGSARDIFDKVLVVVREASRADKRLILDVLRDWEFEMMHTCTLQEFKDAVYSAAGVKSATHSQNISTHKSAIVCDIASLTEDGEEIEEDEELEDTSRVAFGKQLRGMLVKRPFALENIFADLLEEEKRRHAKSEIRFLTLLDEYFFEHPNDTWDECKREIHRHPAYTDMWRADRESAYTLFMNNKLLAKAKRKEKEKEERAQDKEREKDKDEEIEKSKETRDKKSKEIRISEDDKESHSTTSANGKGSADTHPQPSTQTAHLPGEEKVEAGVVENIQAITSDGGCDINANNTNESGDMEKGKEREREETSSDNESKKRKLDHVVDI